MNEQLETVIHQVQELIKRADASTADTTHLRNELLEANRSIAKLQIQVWWLIAQLNLNPALRDPKTGPSALKCLMRLRGSVAAEAVRIESSSDPGGIVERWLASERAFCYQQGFPDALN